MEITLNNQTIIQEAGEKLPFDPIRCNPIEFEHIKKQPAAFETVDMLGTLKGVHPLTIFTHRKKNTPVPKMLITIRNSRLEKVTLALISDLATSDGVKLHDIWSSEVTVLVRNYLVSQYQGNITFSTTAASTILHGINPENAVILRPFVPGDELVTVKEQAVHARWPNALVVKIPDLLRETKNERKKECRLKVQIVGYEKIDASWYSLRITVSDGTSQLIFTLFDAAKTFTGYPIKEYQAMPTEKTKVLLTERTGKMYSFYFNMARITPNDQARRRIVAEAFEKDAPV